MLLLVAEAGRDPLRLFVRKELREMAGARERDGLLMFILQKLLTSKVASAISSAQ